MLIGTGLLANTFNEYSDNENVIVFASGVSNSSEKDQKEFLREKKLIERTIYNNQEKLFIYFSSCALENASILNSPYYKHKKDMELFIQQLSQSYLIVRLPQVFGEIKEHTTLINYLCMKIIRGDMFEVWEEAYRYIIHIDDVLTLVKSFIENKLENKVINIANTYRYLIFELIECIEMTIGKIADFKVIKKQDKYTLDLSFLESYIEKNNLKIDFGKDYFCKKIKIF